MYLFEHKDFIDICEAVRAERKAGVQIVEKDYWVCHVISALKDQGFEFILKGGTSLSKGWNIINRFSEDVDIYITPPKGMEVFSGKNQNSKKQIKSRKEFFLWLESKITVLGALSIAIEETLSDSKQRQCSLLISYNSRFSFEQALKPHVLLEIGFAQVEPNEEREISSWAYELAERNKLESLKDKPIKVRCYAPEYTFVEKLSAITTKYRQEQDSKILPRNFIRHYYDVYKLLQTDRVKEFAKTTAFNKKLSEYFKLNEFIESEALPPPLS